MRKLSPIALLISLAISSPALACIWDYDTLRDERRGLPGIAEILSGRFEKRSEFFYRDRIARMEKLLKEKPDDVDAIDNLAVALFRVGEFDRAVSILQDKEQRFPNQYTTASNLATFYMLHGKSNDAIPLLEKALRINPNAHFDREKYQLKLALYLRSATTQPSFPVADFLGNEPLVQFSGEFEQSGLLRSRWNQPAQSAPEEKEAIDAIVGMIRFGTEDSPDLWYALGSLLSLRGDRHLALRAFMRASDVHHPRARQIDELIIPSIRGTVPEGMRDEDTDAHIAGERGAGGAWAKSYMDFSDDLIRSGKNADDESNYSGFYAKQGAANQIPAMQLSDVLPRGWSGPMLLTNVAALIGGTLVITLVVLRSMRRRHRPKAAA